MPASRESSATLHGISVLALTLLLVLPGETRARTSAPGSHRDPTLHRLDQAVAWQELSYSHAARQKLLYLFERPAMDPRWNVSGDRPAKCGVLVMAELAANLERLDEPTRALYERYAGIGRIEGAQAVQVLETTHFYIEYKTAGPDAPPADDVSPANGVPDYVEQTGTACEFSWTTEITTLGFVPPPLAGGPSNKYLVQFQNQNSYGFTSVVQGGRTKIVVHPDFVGFPPNDDPDGDVLGALRVTVAHEFKHASQHATSGWSEGGWVELDATWAEDIVYDGVNDYYIYNSGSNSPFTEPQTPLDSGGTGSYEDSNWQHYQSEKLGNGHIVAFWQRRQLFPGEAVLTTYAQSLSTSGVSFEDAWGEYVAWNFACGAHAGTGFGYGEAATYPSTPGATTHAALPVPATGGSVEHLAAAAHFVDNDDGALSGTPEFTFTGGGGVAWRVSVLLEGLSGAIARVPVPLSGGAGTLLLSGYDYSNLRWTALVIGNPATGGPAGTYTFSARAVSPVAIAHTRLWNTTNTATPYAITALVTAGTEAVNPSAVSLTYRLNGGATTALAMNPTGNPDEYSASIPQRPVGNTIEYRITAGGSLGGMVSAPSFAGAFYPFAVVTVFEPFEVAGGFTVGAAGDGATTGVWERAIPIGTGAAPGVDFTSPPGQFCFVTQNGVVGGAIGAADVDGGRTTLLSPVYDLSAGGPYLSVTARYRRWYSNHLGVVDDVWQVDASNDGGASWSSVETASLGQHDWVQVNANLLALFGTPGQVRFRFVAEDAGAGSLVEAAVDDFEIIAVPQGALVVGEPPAAGLELGPAKPNPVSGSVTLALRLPAAARISAVARDVMGRTVRQLVRDEAWGAGLRAVSWDGRGEGGGLVGAGVYFVRVLVDGVKLERTVVVLR